MGIHRRSSYPFQVDLVASRPPGDRRSSPAESSRVHGSVCSTAQSKLENQAAWDDGREQAPRDGSGFPQNGEVGPNDLGCPPPAGRPRRASLEAGEMLTTGARRRGAD
jgi:hypothetical protein